MLVIPPRVSKRRGKGIWHLRNFLCASLFWILRLSSGSVTSVQSSVVDLDLDFDFEEEDEFDFFELDSASFLEETLGAIIFLAAGSELVMSASEALRFRLKAFGT